MRWRALLLLLSSVARHPRPGLAPCSRRSRLPRRHRAGSLSLSRCGAGQPARLLAVLYKRKHATQVSQHGSLGGRRDARGVPGEDALRVAGRRRDDVREPRGDLVGGEQTPQLARLDVELDRRRRRARAAIGPPRAASGATWPTISPCVAPEKRPSVMSATSSPRPFADERGGDVQHLAHARAAGRALVADHDDVARAGCARALTAAKHVLLRVEHARRAACGTGARGRRASRRSRRARGCRAGSRGRPSPSAASRSGRRPPGPASRRTAAATCGERAAVDVRRVAVHEPRFQQLARDERDAAGGVQVGRDEAAARLDVGDDRRARGDPVELVDRQRRCRARARSRAGAGRRSSSRRSRRSRRSAFSSASRVITCDGRTSSRTSRIAMRAGLVRGVVLRRIGRRDVVQAGRG